MTRAEPEDLFDKSAEYAEMLERGLRLSGEDRHYFADGRVRALAARLDAEPRAILDFGCGIGETALRLARTFPRAHVLGVDTSANAIEHARREHAGERVRFAPLEALSDHGGFDLCYTNGVFHHIAPSQRPGALEAIHRALRPGGHFALFENNPWNPGTRVVMRRVPFDRDAVTLSPPEAGRLLRAAGFQCGPPRSLFWFPRPLAWLRPLEPGLVRVPLGAQYWVLARRPAETPAA